MDQAWRLEHPDSTDEVSSPRTPGAPPRSLLAHAAAQLGAAVVMRKLQRRAAQAAAEPPADVHAAAAQGLSGSGGALPHAEAIQRSFGPHDISSVRAHTDTAAQLGAHAIGAQAFASGERVAFAEQPSLHTAAHEAAHVVQQRAGVQLSGGVGADGDAYEQHADAVADLVVRGQSSAALLGALSGPAAGPGPAAGAPALQMMRVVRWMDATKKDDYISKLAARDPKAYQELHGKITSSGSRDVMQILDTHGQGMLGDSTPFVSLAINPYSLSWGTDTSSGASVDNILASAPHDVWFDVPDEYLYPGTSPLSRSETELLALLPPGQTLKNYIAQQDVGSGQPVPLIEDNRWRGMSTQQRRAALKKMDPEFTELTVRLADPEKGEPGLFVAREEPVPAPWKKSQDQDKPLKLGDLPETVRQRVVELAADNWPKGAKDFLEGLRKQQPWAQQHLQSTIDDNAAAIRKML